MLGPAKPRRLNESIAVSLEELVPRNNFYRHLEAKLDLSFVHEWVKELYAEQGRPSIDPVIFFKTHPRHYPLSDSPISRARRSGSLIRRIPSTA